MDGFASSYWQRWNVSSDVPLLLVDTTLIWIGSWVGDPRKFDQDASQLDAHYA